MNEQSNPERARKVVERRRSNAAGTHGDRRLKRQKTRERRDKKALEDQSD